MSAVMEDLKRAVVLNPQRINLAEQLRQDWVVNAEIGTSVDDVKNPGYWAHVAAQMQIFDHIEVRMETGEWVANFIVTGVGRNWAAVHMVSLYELQQVGKEVVPGRFEVLWRGAQHKWCVKRKSDSEVVQSGMESKAAAALWLENHERVTSA